MYDEFERVLNTWTKSNNDLPLIRFTGAKMTLYRAEKVDYIFTYHRCYPLKANLQTYQSTQPTILQKNKRRKIVKCRQNSSTKKPYTIVKIRPPAQLTNKWWFQKDLANIPLFLTMCSSCSLDRWYSNSNSISTTVGFTSLNTELFENHNWERQRNSGYRPSNNKWLYSLRNGQTDITQEPIKNLILLGNSKEYQTGKIIDQATGTTFENKWDSYFQSQTLWGNPFEPKYLTKEVPLLITNLSPEQLKTHYKQQDPTKGQLTGNEKIGQGTITETTKNPTIECRYNPYNDKGDNHIFITPITDDNEQPWALPQQQKFQTEGYPLWLGLHGFIDWEKVLNAPVNIETDYICALVSSYISPPLAYYVPIDQELLDGRSKYRPKDTYPAIFDQLHWHPKIGFQLSSLNNIVACGPGMLKLPPQVSAEAHAKYTLYFKIGGCTPPMQEIEDPEKQPTYPTPNNIISPTSLQSPEYPIEYYLYKFDERRGQITKTAATRLKKIQPTKTTLSTITGPNYFNPPISPQETETSETSDEETQTQTLQQLLKLQLRKQQHFQRRILALLQQQT